MREEPDNPDQYYDLLKDEGLRHTRWPDLYDENDNPKHGREILTPSKRAARSADNGGLV